MDLGDGETGGRIALVATASAGEGGLRARRLFACVDIGRVVNRDIALQQIEGGLIFGLGMALGCSHRISRAACRRTRRLSALAMPTLEDCPEIDIELVDSDAPNPFDPGEIGVPPVAPAVANAFASATGRSPAPPSAAIGPAMTRSAMTWQPSSFPPTIRPSEAVASAFCVVNLGTPDAPETGAVRRYLGEFLSDRRVIEIPAIAWQPILRGIILNTRPKKSARGLSRGVDRQGLSAGRHYRRPGEGLQARLGDAVMVEWAMRYGKPSIRAELQKLMDAGCERILLAPLYPQYCGATTATVVDKAADWLREKRWQPSLRTLPPYHDDPAYIAALAQRSRAPARRAGFRARSAAAQFPRHARAHAAPGRSLSLPVPQDRAPAGRSDGPDRYYASSPPSRAASAAPSGSSRQPTTCSKRRRARVRSASLSRPRAFPPIASKRSKSWRSAGSEQFTEAGGEKFAALSCLNAGEVGMDMLETLVRRELSGWIG